MCDLQVSGDKKWGEGAYDGKKWQSTPNKSSCHLLDIYVSDSRLDTISNTHNNPNR